MNASRVLAPAAVVKGKMMEGEQEKVWGVLKGKMMEVGDPEERNDVGGDKRRSWMGVGEEQLQ